jgi:hypothetical protein
MGQKLQGQSFTLRYRPTTVMNLNAHAGLADYIVCGNWAALRPASGSPGRTDFRKRTACLAKRMKNCAWFVDFI